MNHDAARKRGNHSPANRTRHTTDGMDPDVVHTEEAMAMLESILSDLVDRANPAVCSRLDNALLNIAVNRIVSAEGPKTTAAILWRLADALDSELAPAPGRPIELSRLHG